MWDEANKKNTNQTNPPRWQSTLNKQLKQELAEASDIQEEHWTLAFSNRVEPKAFKDNHTSDKGSSPLCRSV